MTMVKQRILTGIRPTGALHLGHYVGALENWVRLQDEYDCFFLIADYQALGDHLDDIDGIRRSVIEVTLDWLAVGLDPQRSTFVVQSYIPEHAELTMLLSMLTPLGMLQRNPTLKAEMKELDTRSPSVGFFNYPVSQMADILLPKANLVSTGDDQLPHIEMTREIVRKFNRSYGQVFPEPKALMGRVPRLVGTDGQAKMSKSLDNCIYLGDDAGTVDRKVMSMYTDPTRVHATDPGHVDGNPVFMYHDAFNTNTAEVAELKERYTNGRVGDVEVKRKLAVALNDFLEPIRERRGYYQEHHDLVSEALLEGTRHAKGVAETTMD
jgi:tryptophanyl-tRNA synthetase